MSNSIELPGDAEVDERERALADGFLKSAHSPEEPTQEPQRQPATPEPPSRTEDPAWIHEQVQAGRRAAVEEAVEAYEAGEDPATLADKLRDDYGPEAALAFAELWRMDEAGELDDDWIDAETWIASEARRLDAQAQLAQMDAQAQLAESQAETQRQIREAAERFQREHPAFEKHKSTILDLLARAVPDGIASPEEVPEVLGGALRGAQELERAEYAANVLADFDAEINREQAFRGEARIEDFDRQQAFDANLAKAINPNAVMPPPDKKAIEAQIDRELFERDRIFENGWNVGGNAGQRLTEEYAHKRGLSPLDPEVQQYAHKRGWL